MHQIYDRTAVRTLLSLGINKDLVTKAQKLNIDLADELEKLIITKLEAQERSEWAASNFTLLEALQKSA